MQRRELFKAAALAAVGAAAPGLVEAAEKPGGRSSPPRFRNEDFYSDGRFDEEKTKAAIVALCRWHGYPVFPGMAENLWVSDYGAGQFARLGLAAYLFANQYDEAGTYMMLDIFLMPGQMLPEHWHLEGDHGITKNEGWLVRWGKSYVVGIGEDNLAAFPQIKIPEIHCQGTVTVGHVVEATPGMFVPLAKVESRHWQFGGPEGGIVTEVANFHTNAAVRHSDPALNKNFLGG